MVSYTVVVQAVLLALFASLTSILWAVTLPTYDGLLVPELQPSALYPALLGTTGGSPSFLGLANQFSAYLLENVVDPAVVLVAMAVGALYLVRAGSSTLRSRLDGLLPRLVVCVVLANVTVPLAAGVLDVAGAVYPVVAGFDGGAWESWTNLAGFAGLKFSWDNGLLAFILSFTLFSLVLLLAIAVAARDALLAVLIVLLPAFTLLGPVPFFAPLAKRAWLLFVEFAFLPSVIVVPLELAVGAPSSLILVAYLALALGAPSLLNVAGAQVTRLGFPSAGAAVTGGVERGLLGASSGASALTRPAIVAARPGTRGASALAGARTALARTSLPFAAPLLAAEGLGRGAEALFGHFHDARLDLAGRRFRGVARGGSGLAPKRR